MTVGKTEHQIRTEERRDITHFEQYMHMHQLEALSVSAQIRVCYFVLWRAVKGKPISFEQARTITEQVLEN